MFSGARRGCLIHKMPSPRSAELHDAHGAGRMDVRPRRRLPYFDEGDGPGLLVRETIGVEAVLRVARAELGRREEQLRVAEMSFADVFLAAFSAGPAILICTWDDDENIVLRDT